MAEAANNTVDRRSQTLTLLLFLLFLFLSFSHDLIEAFGAVLKRDWSDETPWLVLPLDAAIMGFAWWVARRGLRAGGRNPAARWFVAGAIWTLVVDAAWLAHGTADRAILVDIALNLLYLPALMMLWAGLIGIDPWPLVRRRAQSRENRLALLAITPLLIGVGAAYVGESLYWRELVLADQRIHQEYFAQISQIIPLLAVALGLESRIGLGRALSAAEWSVAVFTVILVVLAEALAISALPVDNDAVKLYAWHQFVAFIVTLYACFVALAVLAVVVLLSLGGTGPRFKQAGA